MNDDQQKQVVKFYRPRKILDIVEIIKGIAITICFLAITVLVIKAIISGVWFK